MKAILESAALSDRGISRDRNDDYVYVDQNNRIFVVCDGVGSHPAGDVAADMAARTFAKHIIRRRQKFQNLPQVEGGNEMRKLLAEAINHAARVVCHAARRDSRRTHMSTTLTALVVDDGQLAHLAHVGDSRAYLLRDGKITQLTSDHTYADDMLKAGVLDKEQFKKSRFRHLLSRSVGKDDHCFADIREIKLKSGDRILLCTDGLFREFDSQVELYNMAIRGDVNQAVTRLVGHAKDIGGHDNISAVLIDVTMVQRNRAFALGSLRNLLHRPLNHGDTRPSPSFAR